MIVAVTINGSVVYQHFNRIIQHSTHIPQVRIFRYSRTSFRSAWSYGNKHNLCL